MDGYRGFHRILIGCIIWNLTTNMAFLIGGKNWWVHPIISRKGRLWRNPLWVDQIQFWTIGISSSSWLMVCRNPFQVPNQVGWCEIPGNNGINYQLPLPQLVTFGFLNHQQSEWHNGFNSGQNIATPKHWIIPTEQKSIFLHMNHATSVFLLA